MNSKIGVGGKSGFPWVAAKVFAEERNSFKVAGHRF